jgi:dienelactone hydrolase
MASNPPDTCCTAKVHHDGTPIGHYKDLFGLHTYHVGEQNGTDKVIVIVTDVYGNKLNGVLLIADEFAANGYHVLIPDILNNDPLQEPLSENFPTWFKSHGPDVTTPIVDGFLQKLRSEWNPKFVGGVGYCFGAKYVVLNLSSEGHLDAAAVAHPSFVTIEEVANIKKPLLVSAAETDAIFPPELRLQTESKLKEIGATYAINVFSNTTHGFACKGDLSNPSVKYAKEKTVLDQLHWFNHFS